VLLTVGIHRQLATTSLAPRVTDKPGERVLTISTLAQQLVAKVDDYASSPFAPHTRTLDRGRRQPPATR